MNGMKFIRRNGIKALVALVGISVVGIVAERYLAASPAKPTKVDTRPVVEVDHPRRATVAQRLRILVLGNPGPAGEEWLRQGGPDRDVVRADSWSRGLSLLGREHFDVVLGCPADASLLDSVRKLLQSQRVLATQGWLAWPVCSIKLGLR